MTSRLKQGVVSLGVRTGTKLIEKGKDFAKFGFNLFSSKQTAPSEIEPSQDDQARERSESDSQQQPEQPRVELKWVMVY